MNSKNYRARLLSGTSAAVIASTVGMAMSLGFGSAAWAAPTPTANLAVGAPYTANALVGSSSSGGSLDLYNQYENGAPAASVTDNLVPTDLVGPDNGNHSVTGNLFEANAIGNLAPNPSSSPAIVSSWDLATIGAGQAQIINQVVAPSTPGAAGSAIVTATATGNAAYVAVSSGNTTGAITVGSPTPGDGNTIEALTVLNSATTSFTGAPPVNFSNATTGGAALNYTPPITTPTTILTTQGSVDLTTTQTNSLAQAGAGSVAEVDDNNIYALVDTTTPGVAITSTISVDNNLITANYQGNYANASITTAVTQAQTFTGSLTLGTFQVNTPDATLVTPLGAVNTGSSIYAQIVTTAPTTTDTVAGTVSLMGNTISSSASGNSALTPVSGVSGTTYTGNVITLGGGLSFVGPGLSTPAPYTPADYVSFNGSGGIVAYVDADVALQNVQANLGSPLSASTTSGSVSASIQDMSAGSGTLTIGANAISSAINGNIALNKVVGGSSTDTFAGSIGVQNVQTNDGSGMTATVSDNFISAEVATSDLNGGGLVHGVTIEVGSTNTSAGNLIVSSAYGNQAGNAVDLTYASVTDAPLSYNNYPLGVAFVGDRNDNVISVQNPNSLPTAFPEPGAFILSVQSNLDTSPITSINTGSSIGLSVGTVLDVTSTVTNSHLGVDGNTIEAQAYGNDVASAFNITTPSLIGNAGIGSIQTQAGIVSSSVSGGTVALSIIPDFDTSTASVSGNTLVSLATANSAVNAITLTTTDYSQSNGGGSSQRFSSGSPTPFDAFAGSGSYVFAGLALLNDQLDSSGVTASNTDGSVTLTFNGALGVAGSVTAYNNSNAIGAQAIGNQAANTISLNSSTGGTFVSAPTAYSSLGAMQNIQQVSAPSILASATTTGGSGILTSVVGDTIGATVSMSGNQYSGLAIGNTATNTVDMTGAATIDFASPEFVQNIGFNGLDVISIYGMTTVNNAQYTGPGTITSYVRGSVVAELGTDDAPTTSSTVTLGANPLANPALPGNTFFSNAYDNQAFNYLNTSAQNSLAATGSIFSNQVSASNTTASAGSFFLPIEITIEATNVTDSTLAIVGNQTAATAYANTAVNTMTLSSGNSATSYAGSLNPALTGVVWTAGYLGGSGLGGDYDVGNLQQLSGNVTAYAWTAPRIVTFGDNSGLTESVSGNITQADAEGNVATSTATLTLQNGGTTTGSAPSIAVGSLQIASGGGTDTLQTIRATAADNFGVFNGGTLTGGTVTISGNASNGIAMLNSATNSLTVSSGNSLGSTYAVGYGLASTSAALTPGSTSSSSVADYAVSNVQTATFGSVSAASTTGIFTATPFLEASGINFQFDDIAGATLTVTNNQVFAQAGVNTATNSLSLGAANAIVGTSASVLNLQTNSDTASAVTAGVLGVRVAGDYFFGSPTVGTSTISVLSNSFTATAWGNSATNSVSATATNGFSGYSTLLLSVPGPSGAVGTNMVEGGQVVLNEQVNAGDVSAGSGFIAIGVLAGNGAISGTPINVNGNSVQANAFGNNVTNGLVLNGNNANGAIGNGQVNSASISASVDYVAIGVLAGGISGSGTISNGPINVSNNIVSATAYGNSAYNTLDVLNANTSTTGIASTQINTGAVTATITNVVIGYGSSGGGGANSTVSGNQIVAMAVGNAATSVSKH
jgi:hypothetical protein